MTSRQVIHPKTNRERLEDWEPPSLNKTEFHELYFALRVILYQGNNSATARTIGISRRTADRWITEPPQDPWAAITMRYILMDRIKYAQHHHTKAVRRRAKEALDHINIHAKKRTYASDGTEHMDHEIDHTGLCARALLEIVARKPISTAELRKGRYSTYTLRSYRRAAEQLCLDKRTTGFGPEKITWYALPGDLPPE